MRFVFLFLVFLGGCELFRPTPPTETHELSLLVDAEVTRETFEQSLTTVDGVEITVNEFEKLKSDKLPELDSFPQPPCTFNLATVTIEGRDLSQEAAKKKLQELEDAGVDTSSVEGLRRHSVGQLGSSQSSPASAITAFSNSASSNLTGNGVTIAILDTGLGTKDNFKDMIRNDFGYKVVAEANFTSDNDSHDGYTYSEGVNKNLSGHGTPVAYLAKKTSFEDGQPSDVDIMPIKVCDNEGSCSSSDIVKGICYALNNAKNKNTKNLIINLSLGGKEPSRNLYNVLKYALELGTPIVVSGGNGEKIYPAAFGTKNEIGDPLDGLIAVAALNAEGNAPADFSTHADYIDIAAVGEDLSALQATGSINERFTGTSFAAAQVSAFMALLREDRPDATVVGLESILKDAAIPLDCDSCTAEAIGVGKLGVIPPPVIPDDNLRAAIKKALSGKEPTKENLVDLKTLNAPGREIRDLTGLEHAEELTFLKLDRNEFDNITPLINLENLKFVDISENDFLANPDAQSEIRKLKASGVEVKADTVKPKILDAKLKSLIENTLGMTNPTADELAKLPRLIGDDSGSGISVLTGLEFAESVDNIYLPHNTISDITPLGYLMNLTSLTLSSNNRIDNLEPLRNLKNLKVLGLAGNPISNVEPLEKLEKLEYLHIGSTNNLSDITALGNLENLKTLSLTTNTKLKDISPLKDLTALTNLTLSSNEIKDISSLAKLERLDELRLIDNKITDIDSLSSMKSLTYLGLSSNMIDNLGPLRNLQNLETLELGNNDIVSISTLVGLTNLKRLVLEGNNLSNSDLSSLINLPNLETLNLQNTKLDDQDIEPLAELSNKIKILGLAVNGIIDLSPLAQLTSLETLDLRYNQIENLAPLENLTELKALGLYKNKIRDLSFLANLSNIDSITLDENLINDLSPLIGLTNMKSLGLTSNAISDIGPLVANSDMGGLGPGDKVDLTNNCLDLSAGSEDLNDIMALEARGVEVTYEPQKVLTNCP